jgi:hypothetical protein
MTAILDHFGEVLLMTAQDGVIFDDNDCVQDVAPQEKAL